MGAVRIPNAKSNPRISGGTLVWCAGDIFKIYLQIELVDQDGEPIEISASSTVEVRFRNRRMEDVKTFTFTSAGISENCVTLNFDAAASALFRAGAYTYDIIYTDSDGNKTFLALKNPCTVE